MNPEDPKKVGIWEEHPDMAGVFVVDANKKDQYVYWADIKGFPAKGLKKRVILLGESVARGYLYDPYYTPAQVLDQCMKTIDGKGVEVLDLAKTSLTFTELLEVLNACVLMEPDAIVIFAGNNWVYPDEDFSLESIKNIGKLFSEFQFDSIKTLIENDLGKKVSRLFKHLASIELEYGIKVTFIIPEINLLDWKSSLEENILMLHDNGQTYNWSRLYRQSLEELKRKRFAALEKLARKMIKIDSSLPYPYELMTLCKMHQGCYDEARIFANLGKDTAFFGRIVSKPAMYAKLRECILQEAQQRSVNVINLSFILKEYSAGKLPGRRLFLDYCHLTDEGIRVAMTHTAISVGRQLLRIESCFTDIFKACLQPGKDVKSLAFFYAAIHNAHYGQGHEILDYLCKMAVLESEAGIHMMRDFADFSSRRASNVLCKSYELLSRKHNVLHFKRMRGLWHKAGGKIMDIALVDAMVGSMKAAGVNIEEEVRDLRLNEHNVHRRKINLLDSFYSSTSYTQFVANSSSYYQARGLESEFNFISEAGAGVQLHITYRIPGSFSEEEEFSVTVNDTVIGSLPLCGRWINKFVYIPGHLVRKGVNTVHITWPVEYKTRKDLDLSHITNVEDMLETVYHVYGEIFSFTACGNANNTLQVTN